MACDYRATGFVGAGLAETIAGGRTSWRALSSQSAVAGATSAEHNLFAYPACVECRAVPFRHRLNSMMRGSSRHCLRLIGSRQRLDASTNGSQGMFVRERQKEGQVRLFGLFEHRCSLRTFPAASRQRPSELGSALDLHVNSRFPGFDDVGFLSFGVFTSPLSVASLRLLISHPRI